MRLSIDLANLGFFNSTIDPVTSINSSLLTRQIERLKPDSLKTPRPQTGSVSRPTSYKRPKIATELRAAVDILKFRLTEKIKIKRVAQPSTRLKFQSSNSLSPDKYHQKSSSTGGFEFNKSPRMQEPVDHKLNCFKTFANPERIQEKNTYELKNIQTIQNFNEFSSIILEKTKQHNCKVAQNAIHNKIYKFQEREKRKSDFLLKEQRIKWKESYSSEIKKAKKKWALTLTCLAITRNIKKKILYRKVCKMETQKMIWRFACFTKYLGKFLILLKTKRKFLYYKPVRLFLNPVVGFIEKKQGSFAREISKFLWKVVNSQHFARLLIVWRKNVIVLQVAVRDFLLIRDARILALSRIVNRHNSHIASSHHRRVTIVPGIMHETDIVQPSRKRNIIEYIKFYLQRYLSTHNSFQLLSDHKSQREFFQRPSITSTRKRKTMIINST